MRRLMYGDSSYNIGLKKGTVEDCLKNLLGYLMIFNLFITNERPN